jgi:hypothetical protein
MDWVVARWSLVVVVPPEWMRVVEVEEEGFSKLREDSLERSLERS